VKVCDTATVENTTLLIEDLEAQIVDLEQRVADDTNYLDDFQRQIENYKNLYHEAVAERDRALEYEAWSYTTLGVKMRDFDAEKKGVNRHMAEERLKRIGAETAGSIARIRANYFIQHFNEVSSRNAVLAQDRSDLRKKVRDLRDGLYDLENLWLVKIAVRLHNYFTCGKKYYLRGFMSFPYDPNLDI